MYYNIDDDEESIYESTLEQVVAFDKRGKSVYCENSLYQSSMDLKLSKHNYSVLDEQSYLGNNKENYGGDFHSIDVDDHILRYCKVAKGGRTSRKPLDLIPEDDKEFQDNEETKAFRELKQNEKLPNRVYNKNPNKNTEIQSPSKRKVDKDDIHKAVALNNSNSKSKPKRKIFLFDFSSDVEDEEQQHFETDVLRLKASDTSVCEVNFNHDDFDTPEDENDDIVDLNFNIHRLIFRGELESIERLYNKGLLTADILEQPDHRGNRPIHLAAKLSKIDVNYLYIVQFLLNIGVNFKSKDEDGWTIIDESVTHVNIRLMGIIFDYCCERK